MKLDLVLQLIMTILEQRKRIATLESRVNIAEQRVSYQENKDFWSRGEMGG